MASSTTALHALLREHITRKRYILTSRMHECRDLAKFLQEKVPLSCLSWSKAVVRFTGRASQVLAFYEGDTLEDILNRLLGGMVDPLTLEARSDEGHKLESIAVSRP